MSESKVICENASIEVEGVYKSLGKVKALSVQKMYFDVKDSVKPASIWREYRS